MKKKIASFYLIIVVLLTFSLLVGWIPLLSKQWITLCLGFIVSFFAIPKYFQTKIFLSVLLYAFFVFGNILSGDIYWNTIPIGIVEILFVLVPSSIFYYAIYYKDTIFIKRMMIILLIIITYEAISTAIVSQSTPYIVRELVGVKQLNNDYNLLYEYYKLGVSNYVLPHALPVLIPPLLMGIKEHNIKLNAKVLLVISLVAVIILVYYSGSFTAILLTLSLFVFSVSHPRSPFGKNVYTFTFFLILILFSIPIVQYEILEILKSFVSSDSIIALKLTDFQLSIQDDVSSSYLGDRFQRYDITIEALENNLFLGSNLAMGNHSSLIDRLGTLGIIGSIPLVLFFYFAIKKIMIIVGKDSLFYFYQSVLAFFIMLFMKSMWVWEVMFVFFTILPFLFLYINKSKK